MNPAQNSEVAAQLAELAELEGIIIPPCDLWSDEPPLESDLHRDQIELYQPIEPNTEGWLWSQQLELFLGVQESELRFFSQEKVLIPTPQERAEAAQQQVESERQQRELAQQKVEELMARLRELGDNPDMLEP